MFVVCIHVIISIPEQTTVSNTLLLFWLFHKINLISQYPIHNFQNWKPHIKHCIQNLLLTTENANRQINQSVYHIISKKHFR